MQRPEHIESDLTTEEMVCLACGTRLAWQSRASADTPLGEIVVRAAEFTAAHMQCGRFRGFLQRRRKEEPRAQAAPGPVQEIAPGIPLSAWPSLESAWPSLKAGRNGTEARP